MSDTNDIGKPTDSVRQLTWEELEQMGISVCMPESEEWLRDQASGVKTILAEEDLTDEERDQLLDELNEINKRLADYLD